MESLSQFIRGKSGNVNTLILTKVDKCITHKHKPNSLHKSMSQVKYMWTTLLIFYQ